MILLRLQKRSSGSKTTYTILVTEKRRTISSGGFLEKVGHYKPLLDVWTNKYVYVDFDRLRYWVHRGATLDKNLFILLRPLFAYHSAQFKLRSKNILFNQKYEN